jgi:dienelactone hydrolase
MICRAAIVCFALWFFSASAQLPAQDERGQPIRTLHTPRTFGTYTNANQWWRQQSEIRPQILVSCGLWPLPTKTPLGARVTDRIDRGDYSVEKVYFESFPGLYVTGNLYRPVGRKGPFPAVLNPHGHSELGRLTDSTNVSTVARCIQFARLGMVAFTWDMVGYQDASQFSAREPDGALRAASFYDQHVAPFREPSHQLWNLNLMGVQLWNAIRAVDFVAALPDVNPQAIGCTGESGGATQTILLTAVDDRIKVTAPVVMVSHTMQGGCWCENSPGLRVQHFNVDFAAAAAPRPQLLVAATGDWTKATLEVEAPAIAQIYQLLGKADRFAAIRLDAGHNYNQASREAVYAWFARWFQGQPADFKVREQTYKKESDSSLRVFPDGQGLPGALTEEAFSHAWIRARQATLEKLRPTDAPTFTNWANVQRMTLRRTLQLDGSELEVVSLGAFGRLGKGDRIEKTLLMPAAEGWLDAVVVLAHPDGRAALAPGGKWNLVAAKLLNANYAVLAFDAYQTGPTARPIGNGFTNFSTTYNRTLLQERVQDTLTACRYARKFLQARRLILVGEGEAGAWAMLGGQWADAVIADANKFDPKTPNGWLDPARFSPGSHLLGGLDGGASLLAPRPLLVHNTAAKFSTDYLKAAYQALGTPERFTEEPNGLTAENVELWVKRFVKPAK